MDFERQELNNLNFSKKNSYLFDSLTVQFRFYTIFVEANRNRSTLKPNQSILGLEPNPVDILKDMTNFLNFYCIRKKIQYLI